MWTASNKTRYQIIAQYRGSKLIVNIVGKGLYFVSSARHIFNNSLLLNGFSQKEAALIGYIMATENGPNS